MIGGRYGRDRIYTRYKEINRENVLEVLGNALASHRHNAGRIDYLINYERGLQPLIREKLIRPEIDMKIDDNAANYVKEFKLGYFWGIPAMLVQRGDNDAHNTDANLDDDGISALNEAYINGVNIGYEDQVLGEYLEIGGIGYRMVDIKTNFEDPKDAPFELYTLDPRNAFCVYWNGPGHKKVMSATYSDDGDRFMCTVFTDKLRFDIEANEIVSETINPLGKNPIVEYERSVDRMGCFERQIEDMDGLNVLVSDFANNSSQRTQELFWGNDIEFPTDERGNVKTPKSGQWVLTYSGEKSNPKIQVLSNTFESESTLNAIKYRWDHILQKCKVPTQRSSEGGGSTGTAMNMSTGWAEADADAEREEQIISKGKREELDLVIRAISHVSTKYLPADAPIRSVHKSDVDFHFSRNKSYDLGTKANAFATLVSHGVHGRHAMKTVDLFDDTEQVWNDSKPLIEKYQTYTFDKDESEGRLMSDTSDQTENSPILDGMNTSQGGDEE